ncbi:hypothetical protein ABBQ38_015067 [Trebouxia sp. C0009 RCD-2024]
MQCYKWNVRVAQAARVRSWHLDGINMPGSLQLTSSRGIRLFEIFSKEARVERRRKLKEDMQHGYFDDFRAVRDQQGKIFSSPNRLIDAEVCRPFPSTQVVRPDGVEATLPAPSGQHKASLLCTAFRAGAEDMLASWSQPFRERYGMQHGAHYYELSFVESAVMSVWPFKQMILRAQLKQTPAIPARIDSHETGSSSSSSAAAPKSLPTAAQPSSAQPASSDISRDLVQEQRPGGDSPPQASAEAPADSAATQACASEQPQGLHKGQEGAHSSSAVQSSPGMQPKTAGAHGRYSEPLQTDYIFHFGDTTEIRKALEMPNRLTGYAFLIDDQGLVRWRGSGKAEKAEVDSLMRAADQLMQLK